MRSEPGSRAAEDRAASACRALANALRGHEVTTEALAEFVPAGRRLLVLPRAATMRPLGEVWRLGVLLLDEQGGLWATGRATRAAERGRVGYQSLSREERRDLAAAALRGGYPAGTPVNFDATRLPLDVDAISASGPDSPLGYADGEIRVRWRPGSSLDGAPSLQQYLRERGDLLVNPPLSAG